MRQFLALPLLAISLGVTTSASAQDQDANSKIIEKLDDPAFQDSMIAMMSGFMTAMMDLPIGQFAAVIEKSMPETIDKGDSFSHIDPDSTLGDLARDNDPNFDSNMEEKMRAGTAMMGIMANEFGALLPQLKAMGEKMKRRMGDLE
ncbi:MAG: hypothetical protein V7676_05815 [Parasphingorhabdus sp.]|uniref:hypothetical protein n=1 Tax=Parasphingorhabdus sp. TaxID=2709688 RepID=UPI0030033EC1